MTNDLQRSVTLKLLPNYAVLFNTPRKKSILTPNRVPIPTYRKSIEQLENEKNLRNNSHSGYLSDKAAKRLKNSINWLVFSSKTQLIQSSASNKKFSFRISFITLTLPSDQGDVFDSVIKGIALKTFIQNLRNKYGMNAYVWKAEAQKNGNIHIHFTTNIFISKSALNNIWNNQLRALGLINDYTKKFENMSYKDYEHYRLKQGSKDKTAIRKAFLYGKATKWKNPNTTDVRNVKKVKDLAAYLATYFSKKDTEKRPIKGKIWGCSYNLSDKHKCEIVLNSQNDLGILDELYDLSVKYADIKIMNKINKKEFWVASWFSFDVKNIGRSSLELIKKAYREHIHRIRYWNHQETEIVSIV